MATTEDSAEVSFPPGIEVRPTSSDDRQLLLAYFDDLPPADRRLRFFGSSAPTTHVDRWIALAATGGETFIATSVEHDGTVRCVGEAGYAPRGDGTAEFAMSVATDARGGLGTALLRHLRRRAAARGLRSLHGDVLSSNGAMNHLLRRRGGVTVEREDDRSAGVIIATSDGAPPWPAREPRQRRVLIEAQNGRWGGEADLRAAGFQVAVCPGPLSRPSDDPCPLLVGERCELVDGADLVLHDLSSDHEVHRRLDGTLTTAAGEVPVVRRGPGTVADATTTVRSTLRWTPAT